MRPIYVLTAASWAALVAVQFMGMHLATNLWVLILGVWGAAWLLAIILSVASVIVLRRRHTAAIVVVLLCLLSGIPDGAFGYIHATCPSPPVSNDPPTDSDDDAAFDGNGDPIWATFPLGNGWWSAE